MGSSFRVGQRIEGKVSAYVLSKQLHKDIWTAKYQLPPIDRSLCPLTTNRSSNLGKVIIKSAPKYRLDNERDVLKHFNARPGIRQLVDEIQDPPSLVLKHLDDNLLKASNSKRLENPEIKFIAKSILEALQALHEDGYVHTGMALHFCLPIFSLFVVDKMNTNQILDIKPDNILVNYGTGPCRFRDVELGDCGDACIVNPRDHLKIGKTGHLIGAHMFRSPEAMLNLRWGAPTDIWSFGTIVSDLDLPHWSFITPIVLVTLSQLISLIWGLGWHIFKPDPKDARPDDEAYPNHVLVKQIAFFGPFPLSYFDYLPKEDQRWEFIGDSIQYVIDNQKWKPFAKAEDKELTKDDRTFICKIMKLDPRDRPTAKELLQDPWLRDV